MTLKYTEWIWKRHAIIPVRVKYKSSLSVDDENVDTVCTHAHAEVLSRLVVTWSCELMWPLDCDDLISHWTSILSSAAVAPSLRYVSSRYVWRCRRCFTFSLLSQTQWERKSDEGTVSPVELSDCQYCTSPSEFGVLQFSVIVVCVSHSKSLMELWNI